MSDETRKALEDAIRGHVADEDGDLAVAWVLSVAAVTAEDADVTSYSQWTPGSQPVHVTRGLLDVGSRFHWRNVINEGDE